MALTKPPVLPAWAEAGDKVQPSNAEIQAGWSLSNVPPARQRWNWLLNFLANGIRYFSRRGLPDYDAAETYMIGDRIIGDDGKTYRSMIDNNTAQTPSTSPTKWEEWAPTLTRFAALIQGQTYTAFTTAGDAPNFTLTPSPAIAVYATGQRFRVKFHAVGTGNDVLNVSALGNKGLKQYDSTGAKVAAIIAANQLADVEFDGVDMVIMDPLPPTVQTSAAIQGAFKNLQISTSGTNANVLISADEIALEDSGNNYVTARAVSLTINSASAGANGLDTGTIAASTWYSVWVIRKPDGTTAGLLSLSTTAPTMPSGYTFKARVGWIRTDGTGNKYPLPFRQNGRRVQYSPVAGTNLSAPLSMASGASGTPGTTLSAVATGAFVPSTAGAIDVSIYQTGSGSAATQVTPNQIATFTGGNGVSLSGTASNNNQVRAVFVLESSNIYYASAAGGGLLCHGWEDNL